MSTGFFLWAVHFFRLGDVRMTITFPDGATTDLLINPSPNLT